MRQINLENYLIPGNERLGNNGLIIIVSNGFKCAIQICVTLLKIRYLYILYHSSRLPINFEASIEILINLSDSSQCHTKSLYI